MTIVVFGSINMDLVTRSPRLPRPGETLTGSSFSTVPGGKGANQAVACARLGAPTAMVGRLGDDPFGAVLRAGLEAEGVAAAGVAATPGLTSGIAAITVDEAGENTIVVVPGANGAVGAAELARLEQALGPARALLLQLEVPADAVLAAARLARARGVTVILDPAPAMPLPPELYAALDLITPNESEAAALLGFPLADDPAVERAAAELCARGARAAVIKLGGRGAYYRSADARGFVPAFPVRAVDTVAAGDAFNGALAVALTQALPLAEAVRWAAAAGALAVTRPGAQAAMPRRAEVEELLR